MFITYIQIHIQANQLPRPIKREECDTHNRGCNVCRCVISMTLRLPTPKLYAADMTLCSLYVFIVLVTSIILQYI